MKTKFIVLLFFLFSTLVYGQKLTVFKGLYEETDEDRLCGMSGSKVGNATYQYYENESFERIFNGFFKVDEVRLPYELHINGQFLNNKKNGLWKIIKIGKIGSYDHDISETTSIEYLNGKINGTCSLAGINKKSKTLVYSSTATFKNNVMIGKFTYDRKNDPNRRETNIYILINFDSNGLYDGDYLVRFSDGETNYEDRRKYQNGLLITKIYRNLNNGKIISKAGNDYDYGYFWGVYSALKYWDVCGGYSNSLSSNPIYIVQRGIDTEGFIPENKKFIPDTTPDDSGAE